MKLKNICPEERDRLAVQIRRSVNEDVQLYRDLLSEGQQQSVPLNTVVENMLEQFMESDRDFQKQKKKRQQKPSAAPASSSSAGAQNGSSASTSQF